MSGSNESRCDAVGESAVSILDSFAQQCKLHEAIFH